MAQNKDYFDIYVYESSFYFNAFPTNINLGNGGFSLTGFNTVLKSKSIELNYISIPTKVDGFDYPFVRKTTINFAETTNISVETNETRITNPLYKVYVISKTAIAGLEEFEVK